ncbi:hypothetical protein VFPPC_06782 [Pochonia chlamydosporia 170]|uniref:Uncharacterized protein n=1 Tax=Pochonia chlamydosporia 170 TaxID=1380566 RepID=A0A179F5G7_METCM|nr:hypothetical protein VFPPC_06782 [Pochonia chlamydosporia 170]OAQ60668.2 hypothetical protein VFPPC_06782 [Pochonia chlamydosporia 170]
MAPKFRPLLRPMKTDECTYLVELEEPENCTGIVLRMAALKSDSAGAQKHSKVRSLPRLSPLGYGRAQMSGFFRHWSQWIPVTAIAPEAFQDLVSENPSHNQGDCPSPRIVVTKPRSNQPSLRKICAQ